MEVTDFDFYLPEELIAQKPLKQRDEGRLMVLDKKTGEVSHKVFKDIIDYLNPGDCVVLNDTRVLPARLIGVREDTGGKMELLLLKRKDSCTWETLVKPGKRAKVGNRFYFGEGQLKAEIIDVKQDGNRIVRFEYEGIFEEILDQLGPNSMSGFCLTASSKPLPILPYPTIPTLIFFILLSSTFNLIHLPLYSIQ